jgi:hypothetical protein
LEDTSEIVASEAAFAVGATGERSEEVLRALYTAAMSRSDDAWRTALTAITSLGRYPIISVSSSFSRELEVALHSPEVRIRSVALRTAMRADVPRALEEFSRLLRDPDPELRLDAGYAIAGMGARARQAENDLRRLSADSVAWIREEVSGLLTTLRRDPPKVSPVTACKHRAHVASPNASATLEIGAQGSLRDDRRGPYTGGPNGIAVAQGTSLNFALTKVPNMLGPAADRQKEPVDSSVRYLELDLTRPVDGSTSVAMSVVRDPGAQLHSFFMRDSHGTLWNLRDIPVGAKVRSDRTEMSFFIAGRYHFLQFGPWALGDCNEGYAFGAAIHGAGTTSVIIERASEEEFRFTAPVGSIGRLWEWVRGQPPRDRGLYYFSFSSRLFRPA